MIKVNTASSDLEETIEKAQTLGLFNIPDTIYDVYKTSQKTPNANGMPEKGHVKTGQLEIVGIFGDVRLSITPEDGSSLIISNVVALNKDGPDFLIETMNSYYRFVPKGN